MDTIAAQATPPGNGGVGIIRVSGPLVFSIAESVLGKIPAYRFAEYLPFKDDDDSIIDVGLALLFKGPNSFTGEDVLELQAHGGQVVLDMLLERVVGLGARIAEPGEFSKRAFLNDKIDLAQAEAVADLISATSSSAARSAIRSLSGEFSSAIHDLVEQVISLRLYIESAIDFSEEEIDFLGEAELGTKFVRLQEQLELVLENSRQGSFLKEGMAVVILGQPNAGKSSLLNALARKEAAIVTDIAGTTRDVLRENIQLDGLPLHIIDTAGLREVGDVVEQEGIRRAWLEVEKADRVLYMIDDVKGISDLDRTMISTIPPDLPVTLVFNKIDESGSKPEQFRFEQLDALRLSAKTNAGLDLLASYLRASIGMISNPEGLFLARRRHLDALQRANISLDIAYEHCVLQKAGELAAEDLRVTQGALNEITGEFDNEDLLGRIFSSFCIGK
ncbi:MAG: tRNA uridine-5-carboxymethylaminomethyl(34) synthesis GTPase MnmE [Gammaproteobacteria bacterium]|nr:tRNA uridine-5-carboxymethylaminomethyl(34) synthesis GTPase MnmE [Gammaproteobacteria bacterium]